MTRPARRRFTDDFKREDEALDIEPGGLRQIEQARWVPIFRDKQWLGETKWHREQACPPHCLAMVGEHDICSDPRCQGGKRIIYIGLGVIGGNLEADFLFPARHHRVVQTSRQDALRAQVADEVGGTHRIPDHNRHHRMIPLQAFGWCQSNANQSPKC